MESNEKKNQNNQGQGFYAEPKVFISRDGEFVIHVLPGNMLVRKHVNFYKKVLGIEFTPKIKREVA